MQKKKNVAQICRGEKCGENDVYLKWYLLVIVSCYIYLLPSQSATIFFSWKGLILTMYGIDFLQLIARQAITFAGGKTTIQFRCDFIRGFFGQIAEIIILLAR